MPYSAVKSQNANFRTHVSEGHKAINLDKIFESVWLVKNACQIWNILFSEYKTYDQVISSWLAGE